MARRLGKFSRSFATHSFAIRHHWRTVGARLLHRLVARFPHAPAATLRVVNKRFHHGRIPDGVIKSLDYDDELASGDSLGVNSSASEIPDFMMSPEDDQDEPESN